MQRHETLPAPMEGLRPSKPSGAHILAFAKTNVLATIGALIALAMILVAVGAPVLAPRDPLKLFYGNEFSPPSSQFLLGTDDLARDILSRIIHGARTSLYVGILSVFFGQVIGGLVGMVSGYFGGRTDTIIQRIMDIMMSFPTLILALAIVAALGPSLENVVAAISLTQIPRASRVIRSTALSEKESQYVDAARSIGASHTRILAHHILPQCLAPLWVLSSMALPTAILTEASLSFLGLGVPPPSPTWGGMLAGAGREYLEQAPWIGIFPGVAISLAVFGFNLLGDGLRDILDPRLRGTR
ncbi:MAG: ABC transporter permease [Dehalococcoidia bacterium]|nr:ABC transporter permease [Dehalococcoidia bacterium]